MMWELMIKWFFFFYVNFIYKFKIVLAFKLNSDILDILYALFPNAMPARFHHSSWFFTNSEFISLIHASSDLKRSFSLLSSLQDEALWWIARCTQILPNHPILLIFVSNFLACKKCFELLAEKCKPKFGKGLITTRNRVSKTKKV